MSSKPKSLKAVSRNFLKSKIALLRDAFMDLSFLTETKKSVH